MQKVLSVAHLEMFLITLIYGAKNIKLINAHKEAL